MIPQPDKKPIVVVTEGGPHIWAIINAITIALGPVTVILEAPESKAAILKRRARRQGWISVGGQLATMVLTRLGKRFLAPRTQRIVAENGLVTEPQPGQRIVHVPSANSPECLAAIREIRPGVVFLAGCRMLSRDTLAATDCPVLNYHAAINPKYRGMNGAYWALATGDTENFGSTVHLVDEGVDTGAVLYQLHGKPGHGDNITSYALRLAAMSRGMCVRAIEDAQAGRLVPVETGLPSKQWYHPPIWTYLWNGIRRGVW
ncbi:formyl transferase [Mesorhizobium sp. KR1-2]|uniref:formyl transferase n=1 Tax=Mesorhizobium sp. KR1-2 TaxID=3156609 RepID=UPI0032B4D07D